MIKRLWAWSVTAVLIFAGIFTGTPGSAFAGELTDIAGHRSEATIREAVSLGIIRGYPDDTYRPDGLIKREEFFSMISNVLTVRPDTSATVLDFIDVDPAEWYVPVVKTMVAAKITEGIGWQKVGIGLNITRQEAVKILATIIPDQGTDSEAVDIRARDREAIADWAKPYYRIMMKKGYLNNTEGVLRPGMLLTREEAAILLLKIKKGETVIAGRADQIAAGQSASSGTSGAVASGSAASAAGGALTEGSGTAEDPYRISTEAQLNRVREYAGQEVHFLLTASIRITGDFETEVQPSGSAAADWSGGNFRPIGTREAPFTGTFNGGGHTVSGLKIVGTVAASQPTGARTLVDHAGLFGWADEKSVITNLKIDDSEIAGREYTGAVAGYSKGIVKNCGVGEGVTLRGASYTGGIAGYSGRLVEYSFSKAQITGTTATGGLVGRNYGLLRNSCWLKGTVEQAVGTSGMESSAQSVLALTDQEFIRQSIESYLQR